MSVLIKGMEMPKNCGECQFCHTENFTTYCCPTGREDILYDEIPEWCPLEEPKTGEWIPVEERLPRYNEYVLVYRPEMAIKIIVDCYEEGWTYSKDDAVVAWMPLPEPYKKEGDKE